MLYYTENLTFNIGLNANILWLLKNTKRILFTTNANELQYLDSMYKFLEKYNFKKLLFKDIKKIKTGLKQGKEYSQCNLWQKKCTGGNGNGEVLVKGYKVYYTR